MRETIVWLHNVRSAHNVGSIFRTADAAGAGRVLLSGYTPLPVDTLGQAQKEIAKTALGAETYVPWEAVATMNKKIATLKKEGWKIVGVEQDARAIDYRKFRTPTKAVLIFGNEVRGLSAQLRAQCDTLLEIPMHGTKESLNVSVATGIILFSLKT